MRKVFTELLTHSIFSLLIQIFIFGFGKYLVLNLKHLAKKLLVERIFCPSPMIRAQTYLSFTF